MKIFFFFFLKKCFQPSWLQAMPENLSDVKNYIFRKNSNPKCSTGEEKLFFCFSLLCVVLFFFFP